ncbi:MAG: nucleoside:proton symporter [Gammaproteobacteria bacterium]|nr:nucleoside:proton symporter [Gammaproteobacteria bacterium]
MPILHGLLGLTVFILLAALMSENKKAIKIKHIFIGLSIQILLAVLLSKLEFVVNFFKAIDRGVIALNHATLQGTSFVFGYLGGGSLPFSVKTGTSTFILAFQALPMVIVVAALSSLLFHLRVLPLVIQMLSWLFRKTLSIGGALAMGMSSNLFLGMAESPVVIRPYLQHLTRSELFTLMTCGMAGVAGTVMTLYVVFLSSIIHDVMIHVISAVLISIPATVLISRIIVPETGQLTRGKDIYARASLGVIDALMSGVKIGGEVFVSIVAMLIVFISLIALVNTILSDFPTWISGTPWSLSDLLGYLFQPFMWLMGIPWAEAHTAGDLMATRMVLNELVSYQQMVALPAGALDVKSQLIMVYAMCGFANFGSLGIMLAAYNVLIPERRHEFVNLGFKALIAGTIVTCMTGTIIGMLFNFL